VKMLSMSLLASVLACAIVAWLWLRARAEAPPVQSSPGQGAPGPISRSIGFPNGRSAHLVEVQVGTSAESILATLCLRPSRPVIAIVGGAGKLDERVKPRLAQLFSRAVARVAADRQAVIVDGGTQAGVMALIGQGVADRGHSSDLLGVAPSGTVTYPGGPAPAAIPEGASLEPNHTHFVLVQQDDWGGEVSTMDALAQVLAASDPAVMILADGGPIAMDEVLYGVRREWPIIVLAGTGRVADKIASYSRKNTLRTSSADPRLAEVVGNGRLHIFPSNGTVEELVRILNRYLDPPPHDPALESAWRLFAWLDANARTERSTFERIQMWILGLGLLATFLALLQAQLGAGWPPAFAAAVPAELAVVTTTPVPAWITPILRITLLLVTIATTVLLGVVMRFKAGTRWVLLRGGAEGVKREIFRYRVGVGPYTDPPADNRLPRGLELVAWNW
jgi:TRPM family ion channel/uncharacterized protein DUF4231